MIYRKKRTFSGARSGFYRFESSGKLRMYGVGDGDFVRLKDEEGKQWMGVAEVWDQDMVRYRFRDSDGNYASGISDANGIVLRDEKGRTWRGFVD